LRAKISATKGSAHTRKSAKKKRSRVTHPFMFHYVFSAALAALLASFGNIREQTGTVCNKRKQIVTV
jgi:hypothetical protein